MILCTNINFCSFVKISWKCKIVNKTKKEFTIVFFDLTNTRASGSSTNFNIPTQILSELSPKVQVTASVLKTVTSLSLDPSLNMHLLLILHLDLHLNLDLHLSLDLHLHLYLNLHLYLHLGEEIRGFTETALRAKIG